jgi:hypothetical protein
MGFIANGDWAQYSNVDFGSTPAHQFSARVAVRAAGAGVSGLVEVRLGQPVQRADRQLRDRQHGRLAELATVPANISAVTGVHTVFLTFTSGQPADFVNVNWFTFAH